MLHYRNVGLILTMCVRLCNYAVKKGTGYCYKVQLHNWLKKTMQMSVVTKTSIGSSTFF